MALKLPQIPITFSGIPRNISGVIAPMRQIMQTRFFTKSNERVVTRKDLIALGLITQEQANNLED